MNTANIDVQEKQITIIQKINKIEIMEGKIELDSSASFPVRMINSSGELIDIQFVKIEGAEYTNWGSDDQYVVNLILTKLGLTELV
jgi:hypothetical protein